MSTTKSTVPEESSATMKEIYDLLSEGKKISLPFPDKEYYTAFRTRLSIVKYRIEKPLISMGGFFPQIMTGHYDKVARCGVFQFVDETTRNAKKFSFQILPD